MFTKVPEQDREKLNRGLQRYMRATAKFEEASKDFSTACTELRAILKNMPPDFTAVFEGEEPVSRPPVYLLTTTKNEDFEIKEIELI